MSTSDGLPAGDVPLSAANGETQAALSLEKEIERLANAFFSGVPGPALNVPARATPTIGAITSPGALIPPHVGPHALNVGGGGASPAVTLPPIPGPMHRPPLAATPLPKESDLRAVPTLMAENFGTPSAIAAASGPSADAPAPYFMQLAGVPTTTPSYGEPRAVPFDVAQPFATEPLDSRAFADAPATPAAAPALPTAPEVPEVPEEAAPPPYFTELAGLPRAPTGEDLASPTPPTQPSIPHPTSPGVPSSMSAFTTTLPSTSSIPNSRPEPPTSGAGPRAKSSTPEHTRGMFDPNAVKNDFPILRERVHGKRLVWLDNAATTQKPQSVIDRLSYYYEHENSNIHRAAHALAARSTDAYEAARDKTRRFLNAPSAQEIIFVRGATEGINLIAQSWGRRNVGPGDEIVISWLEHHANIVPWQMLCAEKGARLRVAPVDDRGQIILEEYERLLGPRTKLVSFTQVSNALGTITPARDMVAMAHRHGAVVVLDGAQAVSHMPVDVQLLDCDFYVFSGHKVFAPTGIGVVYGKRDILAHMPPWQGGGNMIADVTHEKTVYQPPPGRFEAGTGNIADAVGLGAALDYVTALGLENVNRYEHELLVYATDCLARVPGLTMIGTAPEKAGVLSFVLDGLRTEDVGGMLDQEGIAVRSGHHCAQPILRRFGLESTVRASLAPYNTREDIDALVAALLRLQAGRSQKGSRTS